MASFFFLARARYRDNPFLTSATLANRMGRRSSFYGQKYSQIVSDVQRRRTEQRAGVRGMPMLASMDHVQPEGHVRRRAPGPRRGAARRGHGAVRDPLRRDPPAGARAGLR